MTNKQSDLLVRWRDKAKLNKSVYYEAVKTYNCFNSYLSWFSIIIATVAGTGSITGLSNIDGYEWVPEVIILLAALLIATQKFFTFNDKVDSHRSASNGFSNIENKIDIFLVKINQNNGETEKALEGFDRMLIELKETAPVIPQFFWDRQVKRNNKYKKLAVSAGDDKK